MKPKDWATLISLAAIWGASFLFMRVAAPVLGPVIVAFLRVAIAGGALLVYAAATRRLPDLRTLGRPFLVLGLLNAAIPYTLFTAAELHLTASLAAILNATTPLFAATVAAVWSRQRLTGGMIGGLVLGFVGVGLLMGWSPLPRSTAFALSVAACLVASLSYGVATNYAKRALVGVPPLASATGQQIGAALLLAPIAIPVAATGRTDFSPSPHAALAVVALALLCTSVAYLLYFRLIESVGAVSTASVTFLLPVFGILWGGLFLGERIRAGMILGLAVILGSVVLVTGFQPVGRRRFSPSLRRAITDSHD
ncbi:MAG: DMT family transporter [Thermomicrobiales bacterium]